MDITIDISSTVLETPRLILRPWNEGDLQDLYAYASVPGVGEMAGWKHHNSIDVSRIILSAFMEEGNVFAIEYKENKKVIGSLGFHSSFTNNQEAYANLKIKEIGYVLSKEYWGQGLMPEALNAIIEYSFAQCKLDALTVSHFVSNPQSRRVIEKCGFTFLDKGLYNATQLQATLADMRYILFRQPT